MSAPAVIALLAVVVAGYAFSLAYTWRHLGSRIKRLEQHLDRIEQHLDDHITNHRSGTGPPRLHGVPPRRMSQ